MPKITRKAIRKPTRKSCGSVAANPRQPKSAAARAQQAAKPKKPPLRATKPWTPAEVREAFSRFRKANPEPKGELEHLNAYTLLVAVVLSAQATDAGVNKATRNVFPKVATPEKMLAFGEQRLRDAIKSIGFFNVKSKNVIALAQKLVS